MPVDKSAHTIHTMKNFALFLYIGLLLINFAFAVPVSRDCS